MSADVIDIASGKSSQRRRPLVGAGLKMFLGYASTVRYLRALVEHVDEFSGVSLFVLPSFPALPEARNVLRDSTIEYGAQDGHWEEWGAYTGAVSPAMLRELGCTFMEVGHAERRRLFGEDDAIVARKVAAAVRCGLVPIVCVGEERAGPDAIEYVVRQTRAALANLADAATTNIVIAYEPVWTIGGPEPADPAHVASVTEALRVATAGWSGPIEILYGGSVTPGHIGPLLAAGVDGVFVGRGALEIGTLRRIVGEIGEAA